MTFCIIRKACHWISSTSWLKDLHGRHFKCNRQVRDLLANKCKLHILHISPLLSRPKDSNTGGCQTLQSSPFSPFSPFSLFSSNNTAEKLMYFPIENLHYLQEEKASPFFPVNESCSGNGAIRALQGWCSIRGKGWGSCSIPVLGISKYQKCKTFFSKHLLLFM